MLNYQDRENSIAASAQPPAVGQELYDLMAELYPICRSITGNGVRETLAILKKHVFNWEIWPDFSAIPNLHQPIVRYERIVPGETVDVGGRKITPLPANHVVPAVGFHIDSGKASLVFSGDTTTCDDLWEVVNRIRNLEYLIIETAFSNAEKELAVVSKHLCPTLLAEELLKLKLDPRIYITHLKPGEVELTMQEVSECVRGFVPKMLQNGQVFEL